METGNAHRTAKTVALVLDSIEVGLLALTFLMGLMAALTPPSPGEDDWAEFGRALGAVIAMADGVVLAYGIAFLVNSAHLLAGRAKPRLAVFALKAAFWNPISALAGMVSAAPLGSAALRYGIWVAMTLAGTAVTTLLMDGEPLPTVLNEAPVVLIAALICALVERRRRTGARPERPGTENQ